jgi:excisionase family DNA binding protein
MSLSTKARNDIAANEPYWTIDQASDYLRIAVTTIYGLSSRGQIPFFKAPHTKKLLFRRSALQKWVESKSHEKESIRPAV